MRGLFVPLTRDELDRLLAVAAAERRRPQDQAAVLLAQVLATREGTTPAADPEGCATAAPLRAHAGSVSLVEVRS